MIITCHKPRDLKEFRSCFHSSSSHNNGWKYWNNEVRPRLDGVLWYLNVGCESLTETQDVKPPPQLGLVFTDCEAGSLVSARQPEDVSTNQSASWKFLPADDFVSEEDSLHLWVLDVVAPLILHHLLGGGVDEPDVEVLLLSDSWNIDIGTLSLVNVTRFDSPLG